MNWSYETTKDMNIDIWEVTIKLCIMLGPCPTLRPCLQTQEGHIHIDRLSIALNFNGTGSDSLCS